MEPKRNGEEHDPLHQILTGIFTVVFGSIAVGFVLFLTLLSFKGWFWLLFN